MFYSTTVQVHTITVRVLYVILSQYILIISVYRTGTDTCNVQYYYCTVYYCNSNCNRLDLQKMIDPYSYITKSRSNIIITTVIPVQIILILFMTYNRIHVIMQHIINNTAVQYSTTL